MEQMDPTRTLRHAKQDKPTGIHPQQWHQKRLLKRTGSVNGRPISPTVPFFTSRQLNILFYFYLPPLTHTHLYPLFLAFVLHPHRCTLYSSLYIPHLSLSHLSPTFFALTINSYSCFILWYPKVSNPACTIPDMAANSSEKKEEDEAVAAEEEDEEEALSLCDLPDNSNKEEDYQARIKADSSHHHRQEAVVIEPPQQEEFDFLLWGGPFSKESEMCVADEVFFQGQILPLCCKSLSSDAARRLLPATTGFTRSESSKSESVTSEFRSSCSNSSSRSSSIRSQNSSSSNSISSTITSITNPEISKPRIRNHHQFHTHPSPKPQLKASSNSSRQVSIGGHHLNRKSSTWDFFRLGVAPAPEIGLQDLKVRCTNNNKNKTCVSRNSSNSSSSSDRRRMSNHGFRQMVRGCKCSVETVPFDIMITKSTKKTESTTTHAMKEKAKQKQRKKAMSRHRTFEWIKELSHAGYGHNNDEEEALLLNS